MDSQLFTQSPFTWSIQGEGVLFNKTEERKDGWKGSAYVVEVHKRAVAVESRLGDEEVGLTTLVQSPDMITLKRWS